MTDISADAIWDHLNTDLNHEAGLIPVATHEILIIAAARIKELTDFCADFANAKFEDWPLRDSLPPDEQGKVMTPYDAVSAWQDDARDLAGGGSVQDRATLEAVLGAVKPLVWGRAEKSGMNLQADCPFGRYYIALRADFGWMWWRPASGPAHMGLEKAEDAAKAAAQADYERRILSTLTTPPADAIAEVVKAEREACAVAADKLDKENRSLAGQFRWQNGQCFIAKAKTARSIAAAIRARGEEA